MPKDKSAIDEWKQKQAANFFITQKLQERANPAYRVPTVMQMGENMTVEKKLPGTMLNNFAKLPGSDKTDILNKTAHLINDMAEMEKIKTDVFPTALQEEKKVEVIFSPTALLEEYVEKLNVFLQYASPFAFSMRQIDKVIDSANELQSIPENPDAIYIFAHRDIHCNNMLYDVSGKSLSFMDFGDSGYCEFFDALVPQFGVFENVSYELIKQFQKITTNPLFRRILSRLKSNELKEIIRIRKNKVILQNLALVGPLLSEKAMSFDAYNMIVDIAHERISQLQ
ncbi:hypothetical protein FACS189452_08830 [Bacteroidia bacterium]|nr:hypothetical protein FACS189452_08830 [Bacteroidia bacterium]